MKTFKELTEATKWKKGDGRPRGASHIENVGFWDLPDASLKYIQKDASDAMKANPEGKKAGKYADEVNDAATVLFWRKKNKIVVKESIDEAKKLKASDIEEGFVVARHGGDSGFLGKTKLGVDEKKARKFKTEKDAKKAIEDLKKKMPAFAKSFDNSLTVVKESVELDEAKKLKASDIVKILKNPEDWGPEGKDKVYTKGKNFVYIDSFYFNGDKGLADLVKDWSSGGTYHKYFLDEYGCNLKIVDKFIEPKATGKHKKLSKDGIIGVELEIN